MNRFWQAFASLTSKERKVIALRLRHDRSFDEIAIALAITPERAREIHAQGLEKLRQRFDTGATPLRELLPG